MTCTLTVFHAGYGLVPKIGTQHPVASEILSTGFNPHKRSLKPPTAAIQWLKNLIAPYLNTNFLPMSMVKSHIPWRSNLAVGLHVAMHQVMFLQEVQGLGFQRKYGGYHWEIWGNYGENIIDQWWIMSFNGFNVAKYGWWVGLCEWFWWSLLGGSSHLVSGL